MSVHLSQVCISYRHISYGRPSFIDVHLAGAHPIGVRLLLTYISQECISYRCASLMGGHLL